MMVNVKLAKDGDGENNVKSWIAKLPSDNNVSTFTTLLLVLLDI